MINKIFLHADDFGRSELISNNIINCIKIGSVNSISVIVGFDEKYFKKIINIKNINIKLHLNLTEKNNFSTLDKDYSFFQLLLMRFHPNFYLKKKNIKAEIEKQILYFKRTFNKKNIKLDSHEHIHVIPWINNIISELKIKHKIIELRDPRENFFYLNLTDFFKVNFLINIIKISVIKFLYFFHDNKENYQSNPSFTGVLYTGFQSINSIVKGINSNKIKNKSLEILIHPGYTNNSELKKFKKKYYKYYSSKNRINEYRLVKSKKLQSILN